MDNRAKRLLRWLLIVLALGGFAWLVGFGASRLREEQRDRQYLDELNSLSLQRDQVVAIKARLLKNDDLLQTDTPYIDVSPLSELLLPLFVPAESTSIPRHPYPEVCQIQIERRYAPILTLTVIWLGNGKLLFTNQGSYCYRRTGDCYLLEGKFYIDEAAALSALISALNNRDDERRSHFEELLRRSAGLHRSGQEKGK